MQFDNQAEKDFITRIAAKLYNDGLTPENFTLSKGLEILDNTVAPRINKAILIHNQDAILQQIAEFTQAEHN